MVKDPVRGPATSKPGSLYWIWKSSVWIPEAPVTASSTGALVVANGWEAGSPTLLPNGKLTAGLVLESETVVDARLVAPVFLSVTTRRPRSPLST